MRLQVLLPSRLMPEAQSLLLILPLLDLQALTVAALSVTASGDVTDSGTLAITGATTIDAGTGNITLDEAASTFGSLALTGANVAVTENDATELAASTVSGTFDITSGGAITNSGALAITLTSLYFHKYRRNQ